MKVNSISEIPERATIRTEYVKCSNRKCGCQQVGSNKRHGPYLYAYWKEGGKTKKRYIGKSIDAPKQRLAAKKEATKRGLEVADAKKLEFIKFMCGLGDPVAKTYVEKIPTKCSLEWAYRKLKERFKEARSQMKNPYDLDEFQSYLTHALGNSEMGSN